MFNINYNMNKKIQERQKTSQKHKLQDSRLELNLQLHATKLAAIGLEQLKCDI